MDEIPIQVPVSSHRFLKHIHPLNVHSRNSPAFAAGSLLEYHPEDAPVQSHGARIVSSNAIVTQRSLGTMRATCQKPSFGFSKSCKAETSFQLSEISVRSTSSVNFRVLWGCSSRSKRYSARTKALNAERFRP